MASHNDKTPAAEVPELLPAAVFLAEVNELLDDVRENVRCRRRRIARARREMAERRD